MKQYVIDQLRELDHEKILEFLKNNADASEFGDIFWVMLPEELYSDIQKEHKQCHPFCFAVDLSFNQADFELLTRSRQCSAVRLHQLRRQEAEGLYHRLCRPYDRRTQYQDLGFIAAFRFLIF